MYKNQLGYQKIRNCQLKMIQLLDILWHQQNLLEVDWLSQIGFIGISRNKNSEFPSYQAQIHYIIVTWKFKIATMSCKL